ncbi:MAG: hypothetical protein IKU51_00700 [Clostridia bacterium]|nr:hypothetical protein [Clostridia bacterium]
MKKHIGVWLCALMLLVSMLSPLTALAAQTPDAIEPTSVDKILERDGYLEGVWYPWFNWYQIGCNLTENPTMESLLGSQWWKSEAQYQGGIDRYGVERIYCDLVNMKAIGYNIIGFAGSMNGEGVVYDDNGDVIGIEEKYLRNVRRFLDICREVGVALLWNVHFHSEGLVDDYKDGKCAWDVITQMICNPETTEHYVENYVRPLCAVLAEYPDVVVMASAMDESDNVINDSDMGDHFDHREDYGVTEAAMINFITRVTETLREELPGVELTLAANSDKFSRYNHLGLDFMGRSMYGDGTGFSSAESYASAAPLLATEFGLGSLVSEEQYTSIHLKKRENMMEKGYKGWFMWNWQSDVGGGHYDVMLQNMKHFTDFRPLVYALHHFVEDYRAAHRGETVVLDTPAMFYNAGDDKVVWIGSRQATKMDLLRSTNGGKTWEKLLDNVDQARYVDADGKGMYTDTTAPKSGYMYKVVVRDDAGNTAESEPTNKPEDAREFFASMDYSGNFGGMVNDDPAVLPDQAEERAKVGVSPLKLSSFGVLNNRPVDESVNLIKNGSFEATTDAQWNTDTFLGDTVYVVEDTTTRSGNKSLYFNSSNEQSAAWHVFWVDVQPNTDYVFSAWVKGAFISDDNRFVASVGVLDPDSLQFMRYSDKKGSTTTRQIVPPSWDNEWHLRSVGFNSGSKTKVGIALYGYASQLWVDDIALFKNGDGFKYSNPALGGGIIGKMNDAENACADEDNLVGNFRLDDAESDYWQTGHGWKNGFLSVQENAYEYGNSLKYTGAGTQGCHYYKWIDIKPDTNYVFSFDLKILESGKGRMSLMIEKMSGPISFLDLDFDADIYGEDWITYHLAFNSSSFTRVAFVVVDLGGSALMDNIRLFEKEKAIYVEDEYLEDKHGWVEDEYDGGWCYYENGRKVTSKWIKYDGGWYYLDADGYRADNQWKKDSNGWCYLGKDGRMATNQWIKDSKGWCYVGGNGYCVTNTWKKDSKGWCYLDASGRMATNKWVKDSVGWCYVGADGYAVTNCWKKDSKGWCYLNASGSMTKNAWVKDGGKWYYLDQNGYMVTNAWKKDSKGWVYVGKDGAMLTNAWCKDSQGWCYVGADGYAVTNCWKKDSKGWIWLDKNGSMTKSKWIQDGGKWYYLDANGYMVAGKTVTIDGEKYTFNAKGEWVK